MQQKQVYLKEALQRISSPEQLNGYIRTSGTAVWFVLGAVLLLLLGIVFWGFTGSFEITLETGGGTYNGISACFLDASERNSVEPGMSVRYRSPNGSTCTGIISSIDSTPMDYAEACDLFTTGIVNRMGLNEKSEFYRISLILDSKRKDEFAIVKIIRKEVRPIDMLFSLDAGD